MIIRSPLPLGPLASMREAYTRQLALEALYLKTHKRKHTIDMMLSSTSRPMYDERGRPKLSNEVIEVRAVYDDAVPAQVADYEWFAGAAYVAGGKA